MIAEREISYESYLSIWDAWHDSCKPHFPTERLEDWMHNQRVDIVTERTRGILHIYLQAESEELISMVLLKYA